MTARVRIGVFGHYGTRNLGDETIITAVIQNIRTSLPQAEICGFSINPQDTSERYGVTAWPVRNYQPATGDDNNNAVAAPVPQQTTSSAVQRVKNALKAVPLVWRGLKACVAAARVLASVPGELRFLLQSRRRLQTLDLLLICGSNQLFDGFGGPWSYPYTLFKWTALARSCGVPVAYLSVGAGPLDAKLSRFFARRALMMADFRSFRDAASKKLMDSLGVSAPGFVYPDLAHSYIPAQQRAATSGGNGKTVIAINPMPIHDTRYWPEGDREKYRTLVNTYAGLVTHLHNRGFSVFLFGTQSSDDGVINDILSSLRDNNATHLPQVRHCSQVADVVDIIAGADIVIATRFHGVLLSLYQGKPTLAICYARKTLELMSDMGQKAYATWLDDFSVDTILEKLEVLQGNAATEIRLINEREAQCKAELAKQYRDVFALLPEAAG